MFCFLLTFAISAQSPSPGALGNKLPTTARVEENEIKDTSVWWSIIFRFLNHHPCLRATLLPARRVGHKSLMKIKQRKNYIHLAVTIVPVFSTPETFQGRFCLRQPFLSSTASAGGFWRPLRSTMFFQRPFRSPSTLALLPLFLSLYFRSISSSLFLSDHPSLIYCIFAKMELIEVVFASARYYSIAFDVTRKSNGVCTTTTEV